MQIARKITQILTVTFAMITVMCISGSVWAATPSVVTYGSIYIGSDTADLYGEVIDTGGGDDPELFFQWGTESGSYTENCYFGFGGLGGYSCSIYGLNPGTNYYFTACATNIDGTSCGSEEMFTTTSGLPTIDTLNAANITDVSADLYGEVTNTGGDEPIRQIEWGTESGSYTSSCSQGTGTTGVFGCTASNLMPNTTYYFVATAENISGKASGMELSFTTMPGLSEVVTDSVAQNITANSAELIGDVINTGGESVDRFIEWGTESGVYSHNCTAGYGDTGIFSCVATSLSVNTTYYFRAGATNSAGTSYGDEETFITIQAATVSTVAAESVTAVSAQMSGDVTNTGGEDPERFIEWGTESGVYGDSCLQGTGGVGIFSCASSNLIPNTTYYFRAGATNSADTSYGNEMSFTTANADFAVVTYQAGSITATTAQISGGVTYLQGDEPERFIEWGTSSGSYSESCSLGIGGLAAFSCNISNLTPNTMYYVRAKATNSLETNYGSEITFTTLMSPVIPSVGTSDASDITINAATLNGNVANSGYENPTRAFEYGVASGAYTNTCTAGVGGVGNFSCNITSLTPDTTYYFRAIATNSAGTGSGIERTLHTLAPIVVPTVNTDPVQNVNLETASLRGSIINTGNQAATFVFEWGTVSGVYTESYTLGALGVGSYAFLATDLIPNTRYYVRAKATNSAGTGYGNEVSFDTAENLAGANLIDHTSRVDFLVRNQFTQGQGYGDTINVIGDLDGDGVDEIAVSNLWGDIYIHFMNPDGSIRTTVDLTQVSGEECDATGNFGWGCSVSGMGDVDDDGVIDLVASSTDIAFIHLMNSDGTNKSVLQIDLNDDLSAGFVIERSKVTSLGDLDGDGVADLAFLVKEGAVFEGTIAILFMDSNGVVKYSDTILTDTHINTIASIGDLNGDGNNDIAAVGKNDGGQNILKIILMAGTGDALYVKDVVVAGGSEFEFSSVASIGDLNDDGDRELILGAGTSNNGGTLPYQAGSAYIYMVHPEFVTHPQQFFIEDPVIINYGTPGGARPLSGTNTDYYYYGWGVTSVGDVNRDGIEDIAVTAPGDYFQLGVFFIHFMKEQVDVPQLVTYNASDVTDSTASVSANISETGGEDPIRQIEWGTQHNVYTSSCSAGAGGAGDYLCNLINLLPNTQYYARAKATNSGGSAYGNEITFQTLSDGSPTVAPTVATSPITSFSDTQAVGVGNITATGGQNPERFIEWGTVSGMYTNSCTAQIGGVGNYACAMTELSPSTTYYYRAYATNGAGTAYGDENTFTTVLDENVLLLTTEDITAIADTQATGTGNISDTGGTDPERFIQWGTESGVYTDSCAAGVGGIGDYSCTMNSLSANTIYYVQAYATNLSGTVYGTEKYFITLGNSNETQASSHTLSATIQETLTLNCGADIDLDNATTLIPGTPQTNTTTCTVTTNDAEGYNLSLADDRGSNNTLYHQTLFTDPNGQIQDKTPWDPTGSGNAQAWSGDGMGFGILSSTATKNESWWGTGTTCDDTNQKYAGIPSTDQNILEHTSYSNASTDTEICYQVNVPSTQIAGEYTGSVTYTATGRP